jgi:hypothetical protein
MYSWYEGREELFCNYLVHLCIRKGPESALISISANLKPLYQDINGYARVTNGASRTCMHGRLQGTSSYVDHNF